MSATTSGTYEHALGVSFGSGDGIDVVIIDDHALFSRGLELLLRSASEGRIHIAGRTDHAAEALALVRRHQPHLALVDLTMPPPGGVAAIRDIKRHYPQVHVLALSGTEDGRLALDALDAGAEAFIPKSSDPDVLVPPMLSVVAGLAVVPNELLRSLLHTGANRGRRALARLGDHDVTLWRLVASGSESQDIARGFHVSERTAKRMVASLLRRLGVANRLQAAVLAGGADLLDDIDPPF